MPGRLRKVVADRSPDELPNGQYAKCLHFLPEGPELQEKCELSRLRVTVQRYLQPRTRQPNTVFTPIFALAVFNTALAILCDRPETKSNEKDSRTVWDS